MWCWRCSCASWVAAARAASYAHFASKGALAVAQTTEDAELRGRVLAACRENARALLERGGAPVSYFWEPAAK